MQRLLERESRYDTVISLTYGRARWMRSAGHGSMDFSFLEC